MKINGKELAHYIIGGAILIVSFVPIMNAVQNIYLASGLWILEYIVVDQILHVAVKNEKITIVE